MPVCSWYSVPELWMFSVFVPSDFSLKKAVAADLNALPENAVWIDLVKPTPEEDKALEVELLADEKERAEHIMLVDLGRNDLGRVCEFGSVQVNDLMVIERYSHVMHIVSDVTGTLSDDKDAFDLIRASFPAGTVSGAPKVRAMQIIDELEPTKRGLYAGAVGFFSLTGDFDGCIAIRSIYIKDGMAYVQAGGGVVYDSVPEKEYEESRNKAKAALRAIEIAQTGL